MSESPEIPPGVKLDEAGLAQLLAAVGEAQQENARLREALERAARELGVPTGGYPAPVANAWRIIVHALAPSTGEVDDG